MANCPNKNLEEWKLLVASRGEDVAYYLWDKYNTRVPESESKVEIVKTGLKATNILQSTKADQFFGAVARNKISGDFFWKKMQADLGIPKDQLEILKSFNTQDRGELIASLLANYSYAVEINITKNKIGTPFRKAEFAIKFGHGIDNKRSVIDIAINKKIITESLFFIEVFFNFFNTII